MKGILFGLGMFGFLFVAYIIAMTRSLTKSSGGGTVGIDFISILKNQPMLLIAFLACVTLGVAIVAMWPTRIAS